MAKLKNPTPQFLQLLSRIQASRTILLSTHRQADGDGIGSQIALYHALKKAGKKVRILNVDPTAKKYRFLNTDQLIQACTEKHDPIAKTDLALIFDTNDQRLVEPLYSQLTAHCSQVLFIDHHPPLAQGPQPTPGSVIVPEAASTGEITYFLIRELGLELDAEIARALYASIVFDTQLFRFIRGSANTHLICADLLKYELHAEEVHRALMATHTVQKISFLAKALARIEYYASDRLAFLKLRNEDFEEFHLEWDESRDVIDLLMNIESLEAAVLFREDGANRFKLSLRSKGNIEVLSSAESMGGGGHVYSSGAFLEGDYEELKKRVLGDLLESIARRFADETSKPG